MTWLEALVLYGVPVSVAIWAGLLKPLGIGSSRYMDDLPDGAFETRADRIARLECANEMCDHMVDGQHPRAVVNRDGVELWTLNGVTWRQGEDPPERV